jgi:hypothetical protein
MLARAKHFQRMHHGRWSLVAGRWSLVAGVLITLLTPAYAQSPTPVLGGGGEGGDSVSAVVDQTGTTTTTTAQPGPFGNSIEPGGVYAIAVTGKGKGTPKKITTELFKKNAQLQWVSQGAATEAPLPNPIPQSGSWSNVRYKNLPAGTYKITSPSPLKHWKSQIPGVGRSTSTRGDRDDRCDRTLARHSRPGSPRRYTHKSNR